MINEIKRRLNIGETVELECVDWNKFSRSLFQRTMGRKFTEIVIESVDDDNQTLTLDSGVKLLFSELKYFKIKDQAPTFNDLIDMAVKAMKDGFVCEIGIRNGVMKVVDNKNHEEYLSINEDMKYCKEKIESLYTETFVIDHQSDLSRIKLNNKKTKVVLAYRELVTDEIWDYLKDISGEAQLKLLKGATVTQRKENESKY